MAIAEADAVKTYRDLTAYRISLVLESDGWHVDYELKQKACAGGRPHYVVAVNDGTILSKRYEQ